MHFETKRKVTDKVFTVEIKFDGYGADDMDAAEEEALIDDLGDPQINLSNVEFKAHVKVDGDKRVVVAEDTDPDAQEVSFIVNGKSVKLDKNFSVSYKADARQVPESEMGTALTSKLLVAEARALIFQTKVHEAIKEAVEALKEDRTRFETEMVATLTV